MNEGKANLGKKATVKVAHVGTDAYKYYDSWVHPVVRELAPAMPGAMPISRTCRS